MATATEPHADLRGRASDICSRYPHAYCRELDARREYPEAFVKAPTAAGYLAALTPEEYGGSGVGITEATIVLEEVNRNGANGGACHELRLQAFGVSGPTTASGTTQIETTAVRDGDRYLTNGQKVSQRPAPFRSSTRTINSPSLLIHLCQRRRSHEQMAVENLIDGTRQGFGTCSTGLNPERILIATDCVGDALAHRSRVPVRPRANRRRAAHRPEPEKSSSRSPAPT